MKTVAFRIPEAIKEKMKLVPEDWSEYLRQAVEERIMREERKKIAQELEEIFVDMPKSPKWTSAKSVREDRDNG